jgi:hypothetical protein
MATSDAEGKTLDFVIAVAGPRSRTRRFLAVIGAKFDLSPEVFMNDPAVSLSLGDAAGWPGWRVMIHLSAYESERARADAVIAVLGQDPADDADLELIGAQPVLFVDANRVEPFADAPPDATTCRGDLESGVGVFDALKAASRGALVRAKSAPQPLAPMPGCVREGLHRHDKAASPALPPNGAPAKGQQVKLQLNLREDLECAAYPGETMGFLALTGPVHAVHGPDTVEADLVATTDRAPKYFDGHWRARLVRKAGWDYPWILEALERLPEAP